MPLHVYLRPNVPYLVAMIAALGGVAAGVSWGGITGVVLVISSGVFLAFFAVPVVMSTVLRTPLVTIDEQGIRLPFMRVRLAWTDISSVQYHQAAGGPLLLLVAEHPGAVIDQAWPWLRPELRDNLGRHGSPVVIRNKSLSQSCEQILAAIHRYEPKHTS